MKQTVLTLDHLQPVILGPSLKAPEWLCDISALGAQGGGAASAFEAQSSSTGFGQLDDISVLVVFGVSLMLGNKCALQRKDGTEIWWQRKRNEFRRKQSLHMDSQKKTKNTSKWNETKQSKTPKHWLISPPEPPVRFDTLDPPGHSCPAGLWRSLSLPHCGVEAFRQRGLWT